MYYCITGKILNLAPSLAVIDAGGVGYEIIISDKTLGFLGTKRDETVRVYTHLHVREDEMSLYGFMNLEEKKIFELLISISGIGPKAAMAILSTFTPDEFSLAIMNDDAKSISKAPGIGGRTAQKIILELKDKIAKGGAVAVDTGVVSKSIPQSGSNTKEALDALSALGYTRSEALSAISFEGADKVSVEELIRMGLKRLTREK